ncbi:uncharacterized protein LOC126457924 [Schistocerca serialis cubense]|uniref:uncharacterized protein LOC126457924 n=1 Tax=Schistocerca serialis cubense TaxID=2023355 RepID=UPI00214F420F|nr:uncharacterized protein LOC126457924 [Schistocerca serialis cubense]XP_049950575.1 uncharacterized protein LOC126457924 [Schistocerca serialis cubense]
MIETCGTPNAISPQLDEVANLFKSLDPHKETFCFLFCRKCFGVAANENTARPTGGAREQTRRMNGNGRTSTMTDNRARHQDQQQSIKQQGHKRQPHEIKTMPACKTGSKHTQCKQDACKQDIN